MGKGDIKSKKGKITNGSFGKVRPARKKATATIAVAEAKPAKAAKKK